jgi:hypothetical protein
MDKLIELPQLGFAGRLQMLYRTNRRDSPKT